MVEPSAGRVACAPMHARRGRDVWVFVNFSRHQVHISQHLVDSSPHLVDISVPSVESRGCLVDTSRHLVDISRYDLAYVDICRH